MAETPSLEHIPDTTMIKAQIPFDLRQTMDFLVMPEHTTCSERMFLSNLS